MPPHPPPHTWAAAPPPHRFHRAGRRISHSYSFPHPDQRIRSSGPGPRPRPPRCPRGWSRFHPGHSQKMALGSDKLSPKHDLTPDRRAPPCNVHCPCLVFPHFPSAHYPLSVWPLHPSDTNQWQTDAPDRKLSRCFLRNCCGLPGCPMASRRYRSGFYHPTYPH